MLGDTNATATVAVRDLASATRFYEDVLGLARIGPDRPGVALYRAGDARLLVYQSTHAGTNEATAVTWTGLDVDAAVRALGARGVRFERYALPDTHHEGDVHVSGTMRVAWFRDPDGNIHALVNDG